MKFTEKDIRFLMNRNYLLSEIREIEKHDFEFESVLYVSGRRLPLTENVALKYLGERYFWKRLQDLTFIILLCGGRVSQELNMYVLLIQNFKPYPIPRLAWAFLVVRLH
mgnify:CR=1 FL=1